MGKSVGENAADGAQRRIDRQKKQARERRFAREQVQHRQMAAEPLRGSSANACKRSTSRNVSTVESSARAKPAATNY